MPTVKKKANQWEYDPKRYANKKTTHSKSNPNPKVIPLVIVQPKPEKPSIIKPDFDAIIMPKEVAQWVGTKITWNGERWIKPPRTASNGFASVSDWKTWSALDAIQCSYERGECDGIGFVLTPTDRFVFGDLDNCRNPETGEITAEAIAFINRFKGILRAEPSITGRGIRLIGQMEPSCKPSNITKTPFNGVSLEFYFQKHYCTIVGQAIPGYEDMSEDATAEILKLCDEIVANKKPKSSDASPQTPPPMEGEDIPEPDMSDEELDEMMRSSEKIDEKHGITKGELYIARASGDSSFDNDDDSLRDFEHCLMLAWWCRRNPDWMDSMFRTFGPMRDKWDERRGDLTYGDRTIEKAIDGCREWRGWVKGEETDDEDDGTSKEEQKSEESNTKVKKRQSRYRKITIEELFSRKTPQYLLDAYLYEKESSILLAESGTGKSFVALDMALSVACGISFMGHPTLQRKVLYVAAEGASGYARRIDAWLIYHKKKRADIADNFSFVEVDVPLLSKNKSGVNEFIAQKKAELAEEGGDSLGLIVLDTLSRCTAGEDENNNGRMALAINEAERIRDELGAMHVLIIHHISDKEGANRHGRGASSLFGAVSAVLTLAKKDDILTLSLDKSKDHEESVEDHMRRMIIETSLWDEQNYRYVTSCIMEPATAPEPAEPSFTTNQRILLDLLPKEGLRYSDWLKAAEGYSINKNTFNSVLKQLKEKQAITVIDSLYMKNLV